MNLHNSKVLLNNMTTHTTKPIDFLILLISYIIYPLSLGMKENSALLGKTIKAFVLFAFLLIFRNETQTLYEAIFDTYTGIGLFVTATLFVVYFFEHYTENAMVRFLNNHQKLQVPVSSLLGVLPGCGGAIIVVTQYSKGYMTFGSFVAVLIASMGDAAILLLQKKPMMALILFAICITTATIVGYILDTIYKEKFVNTKTTGTSKVPMQQALLPRWALFGWLALFLANAILHFSPSAVVNFFGGETAVRTLNIVGIISVILMWIFKNPHHTCNNSKCRACTGTTFNKVIIETSFIVSWILIGVLTYKAIFMLTHFDVQTFVNKNIYYTPLLTAIIGLIPGCGPQIIVTTFYINGMIPFSAQVSNALSNDGDALFPAFALQPKKALMATIYSFIPALIVGYIILTLGF